MQRSSTHRRWHEKQCRYIFYFNDLQIFERYTSSGIRSSYTNLLTILTEPNGENPPKHNYSQLPMGMLKGNDLSIVDITERAVQISNKHWWEIHCSQSVMTSLFFQDNDIWPSWNRYALDVYNVSKRNNARHKNYHDWLPWKHMENVDKDDFETMLQGYSLPHNTAIWKLLCQV
jgi:hypothetical protein